MYSLIKCWLFLIEMWWKLFELYLNGEKVEPFHENFTIKVTMRIFVLIRLKCKTVDLHRGHTYIPSLKFMFASKHKWKTKKKRIANNLYSN